MQKISLLLATLLLIALSSPSPAIMGVSCNAMGAGVRGMISDTDDIVEAINCLGKQIADVRSNMPVNAFAVEQQQNSELIALSAKSSYLQNRLDDIERRLSEIERRLAGVDFKKEAR